MATSRNKKAIPYEVIEVITKLKKQGVDTLIIAERTGVKHTTVKTILRRVFGPVNKDIKTMYKNIEIDRTKMTVDQVAAKYGKTPHHINYITSKSELKSQFIYTRAPRNIKIVGDDEKPKGQKPRVSLSNYRKQKDAARSSKDNKVFKNVDRVERPVKIHDAKNTTIYVKESDTRSDDQIRLDHIEKQQMLNPNFK